jgi:anthranilate phosphoribosyltransferase
VKEAIGILMTGKSLTSSHASLAMESIMRGEASPSQIAAFLVALRMKGETVDELTALASTARRFATPISVDGRVLDTCGTGGDMLGTFNISTVSAIVAAACGVRVAKHGNRSVSSSCGSGDVLEALGVRIDLGPEGVARCIEEVGIGFMFAPIFHPSFRHAALPRRDLGVRTVFNLLGPLCNPAHTSFQTVGVPDRAMISLVAAALGRLGVERALVFCADDGMDELSTTARSSVVEIFAGHRSEYRLDPEALGLPPASLEDLKGVDATVNAELIRAVLEGERGPRRDVVLLNAAAALRAAGVAVDWTDGLALGAHAIDSGRATAVLERWVHVSQAVPAMSGGA